MHQLLKKQNNRKEENLTEINNNHQRILDSYITDARDEGKSKRTIDEKNKCTRKFISFLENNNTSISKINDEIINKYIKDIISQKSLYAVIRDCSSLRVFLRFLFTYEYVLIDFNYLVPIVKRVPRKIPTVWNENEINDFLNTSNEMATFSPIKKRNHVMFLLAIKLGLRKSDILNLKFENIDWSNNKINIIQMKNKNPLTLPLTKEIGWALIDYLKTARPKSNSNFVFTAHKPPFEKLINPSFEIKEIAKKAGIDLSSKNKKGIHSFRFSLATQMLNKQTPLDIISSVLGHTNKNSTNIYLRVDYHNLRKCCLEVSELWYTKAFLKKN